MSGRSTSFSINGNFSGILPFLILRVILDISYIFFVSRVYSSMGFDLSINIIKVFESYVWLFIIFLAMPKDQNKVSSLVIQIFILSGYLPLQSFYALSNESRLWFYLATGFWLLLIYLNNLDYRIKIPDNGKTSYFYLILTYGVVAFIGIFTLFSYFGISFNFDLSNVYEIRRHYSAKNIPLGNYLFGWIGQVILPFLALVALFGKRFSRSYLLFFIVALMIFILFSVTGHKNYLFGFIATLGIVYLISRPYFLNRITSIFVVIISTGLGLSLMFGHQMFGAIFIQRLFFTPVLLSYHYYDFFRNKYILLSHSVFSYFFDYPYDLPPRYLIGKYYMDDPQRSSNNGVVADAFMNFGIFGLVLWPVIIFVLLKFADELCLAKNKLVLWPLIILSFYTMINAPLLTTLLTHGLLIAFLIAFYFPREKQSLL